MAQAPDFPVVEEKQLRSARKRMLGLIPSIRDLSELPAQKPGTVYVFHDGSRWTVGKGGRLKGTEDYVVDAIAVSLVADRPRDVDVDVPIPSKESSQDFTVRVTFSCSVTDAALVAKWGPIDVVTKLRTFVQGDRVLESKGMAHPLDDIHEVRQVVQARVRAFCAVELPRIPGVEVTLSSVQVLTPKDLEAHGRKIQDIRWTREQHVLRAKGLDSDVEFLTAKIKSDPDYVRVRAYIGDDRLRALVHDEAADRAGKTKLLLDLIEVLQKGGHLDLIPIDGQQAVNRLMEQLVGSPNGGSDSGPVEAKVKGPDAIESEATAETPRRPSAEDRFESSDD